MAVDIFSLLVIVLYFASRVVVVAQSSLSIVCVAGQCFQGYSNTTIGATLSGSDGTPKIHLLPGQYTNTTNPRLLRSLLTSDSSTLVGSMGFKSASLSSLPLNLQLEPGVAIYSQSLYSGQTSFATLPESPIANSSILVSGKSIAIAPDVWIAVSNNNRRLILWDSVPDISQLPSTGSLSLLDVQSSVCSPPCSSTSVCSGSGTCTCSAGFTGSACESCRDGFFGPNCQPCPDGCSNCDQGMSGSGRCLTLTAEPDNLPAKCNCLNGLCGSDGQCACSNGWTTADNGTACAKCAPGFFLSTTGDCQVCNLGCSQCTDGTGDCVTCRPGLTIDPNHTTQCIWTSAALCPTGTFSADNQCSKCSPLCGACMGPTEKNCTLCTGGLYFFNGDCRITDGDGVCQETNGMIANRIKNTCDSCGPKCTSCKIANFYQGYDQLECKDCLPGFFLSEGKCVADCPTGMFAPENDNICTRCSSSCSTCSGSPDFCLTCPGGQFASSGQCITSCPSDSFSSSGSCLKCHPDCSTCSGASFDQCHSCPSSRPALTAGRCLSTCSQLEFLDTATSTCQACDPSCSSCSGSGARNCLGCSSSSQVLLGGSCVPANCEDSSGVIPGLGVCLSDLVQIPNPSPTPSESPSESPTPSSDSPSTSVSLAPLPTVTGLTNPTGTTSTNPINLVWWQILLMVVGCTFIFFAVVYCWRWRARKHRDKKTKTFAREKNLDGVHGWLVRLGQRLFRGKGDGMSSELPMKYAHESLHSPKIRPVEDDIALIKKELDDVVPSYEHFPTRKNENPRRLDGRMDPNSNSLYSVTQRSVPVHREFSPRDHRPWNRGGVPVDNRLDPADQAYIRAILPTIAGEMSLSSPSHQSTLSRFPSYISPRPVEPAFSAFPQRNRMPATSMGNHLGPLPPQFHVLRPAGPPNNPFRYRGP